VAFGAAAASERHSVRQDDELLMRLQFTIRTLMIGTAIVAGICSWIAFQRHHIQRRQLAIARLEDLSGPVSYYNGGSTYGYVYGIELEGQVLDKSLWTDISMFGDEARSLWLGETNVTDAELRFLRRFRRIEHLSLYNTKVTSDGIDAISNLASLNTLIISNTLVDDRAVPSLEKLHGLTVLNVHGTRISDAGITQLRSALPNCCIVHD
jgi:hypothetical protein